MECSTSGNIVSHFDSLRSLKARTNNLSFHIIPSYYRTYTPIIKNRLYATCSRNKDGGRTYIFSLWKPLARRTTWSVLKPTSTFEFSSRVFGAYFMTRIFYKYFVFQHSSSFSDFTYRANTLSPV